MIKPGMSTQEVVEVGVKLFAEAEQGLKTAMDALIEIREVYPAAYANGDLKGGDALKARNDAVQLASMVASVHTEVVLFHEEGTLMAKNVGADIPVAYAELPPKSGITTRGGDR